jgi:hypothetical protein
LLVVVVVHLLLVVDMMMRLVLGLVIEVLHRLPWSTGWPWRPRWTVSPMLAVSSGLTSRASLASPSSGPWRRVVVEHVKDSVLVVDIHSIRRVNELSNVG